MAAPRQSDGDSPAREQLSALRSLLVLAMLLTQQDSQAAILDVVANAVESLGRCQLEGIYFDGRWQDVQVPGRRAAAEGPPTTAVITAMLLPGGGQVELADAPWAWAYPLSSPYGPGGYLIVGAAGPLAESERFLLQVLAQQAAGALANAHLHHRERERAAELQVANLALRRGMEIHDRLTRVALADEGQDGIARAVYELTDRSAAIEDRFGNLRAWAGPDRPGTYPRADPRRQKLMLARAMAAASPIRDQERLVSVAVLGGAPMGVLAVRDPDGTAGDSERMAIEHATTVLTIELARLQSLIETETRLRTNLVLELVEGADRTAIMNRAQALGYDLGGPHRVVLADGNPADEIDMFFHAVSRAARAVAAGSLLAPRLHDVILLAGPRAPWDQFRQHVVAELHGGRCRVGVGGRCQVVEEFPRSYREAELALRIQKASGGPEQVTRYDDLGVYKVLAATNDTASVERFVDEWLARLIDYDSAHGTQLVLTLSEYLECGGNYDASAKALSVHRSTLKYRLNRIRQVSGYDLSLPDNQFNLQLATRAWRTLQALRRS
jgi:DNA-binding PucR family transcriptional regulator